MAVAVETTCPNCGKETRTIAGRCPNCAFLKDPTTPGPPARRVRGGGDSVWETIGFAPIVCSPLVILVIVGLLFSIEALVAVGALLLVLALGMSALTDWW